MKKILLLTLAALCSIGAQAQIVSSSSRSLTTTTTTTTTVVEEKTSISYLRFGLNMSTLSGEGLSDLQNQSKVGYSVAYGFHKPIAQSDVYWGMEFGVSSRGYVIDYDGYYDKNWTFLREIVTLHTVQVSPLNIGYKYAITDNIKLDAHLGVYIAYDYTGSVRFEDASNDNDAGNDLGSYSLSEYGYSNQSIYAGVTYGAGVWFFNKLNLDFQFQQAPFMSDYDDCKIKNCMIRLGIAF